MISVISQKKEIIRLQGLQHVAKTKAQACVPVLVGLAPAVVRVAPAAEVPAPAVCAPAGVVRAPTIDPTPAIGVLIGAAAALLLLGAGAPTGTRRPRLPED